MAGEIGSLLGGFSGSTIGSAVVKLYLDSKAYQAEMAAAQAKTGTAATGMAGSLSKFKAYGGLAFAAVGTAAVAYAAKSITAASTQEEALNKVNVVFGEAAGSVRTFADQAAASLGISETAALSAAGTFGNLFSNVGFTADATAEMSTELVGLAADLASFNNIDPTLALEKLRAGLAGEAEPLRAVGVFLSEAKVQAEAFSSGIAEAGSELTDQQKIQARYNLILKETGLAQGDFARTSDSLANTQRILQARMEDLSAAIGRTLIPIVSELVGEIVSLADALDSLGGGSGGGAFGSVAATVTKFLTDFNPIIATLRATTWALTELDERLHGIEVTAQPAGARLMEIEDIFDSVGESVQAMGRKFAASERNIGHFAGMSDDVLKEWRSSVIENIRDTFGTISEFDGAWSLSAKKFERNADQMARQSRELTENLAELRDFPAADNIKKALLDEGPAAIHAFAQASREGKRNIIDDLTESQQEFRSQTDLIEEMTGKLDKVPGKRKAEIEINYKTSGIPLDVLKSLPGLEGEG